LVHKVVDDGSSAVYPIAETDEVIQALKIADREDWKHWNRLLKTSNLQKS
jgi:hypothetical protein